MATILSIPAPFLVNALLFTMLISLGQLYGKRFFAAVTVIGQVVHNGDRIASLAGYRDSHTHRPGGRSLTKAWFALPSSAEQADR